MTIVDADPMPSIMYVNTTRPPPGPSRRRAGCDLIGHLLGERHGDHRAIGNRATSLSLFHSYSFRRGRTPATEPRRARYSFHLSHRRFQLLLARHDSSDFCQSGRASASSAFEQEIAQLEFDLDSYVDNRNRRSRRQDWTRRASHARSTSQAARAPKHCDCQISPDRARQTPAGACAASSRAVCSICHFVTRVCFTFARIEPRTITRSPWTMNSVDWSVSIDSDSRFSKRSAGRPRGRDSGLRV